MNGKVILLANELEIIKAETLGINLPEAEYVEYPIVFDIDEVSCCYMSTDINMVLHLKSSGSFNLAWDEKVFNEIKKHLNSQI